MRSRTLIWSVLLHSAAVATLHWTIGLDRLLPRDPVPVGILASEASAESPENRSEAPHPPIDVVPTPKDPSEIQPRLTTEPDSDPIDPRKFADPETVADAETSFERIPEPSRLSEHWNEPWTRETESEPEQEPVSEPSVANVRTRAKHHGANRAPNYPARAREMRWEGAVVLEFQVDFRGDVARVDVLKSESCRYGMLKDAARRAVEKWTFDPAQLNGRPVDSWYCVRIVFKLGGIEVQGLDERQG